MKVVALLLSLALVGPGAAFAEVDGTWAVGVTGQYDLPLFKLKNWFPSGGIDFGGTVSRINNEIERLLGEGAIYVVRQGLSYFKVVVERGARTAAKAYAGMSVLPYRLERAPGGAGA